MSENHKSCIISLADDKIADIKQKLQQLVSSGEGEGDLMSTMDELKTKYADFGRDRTTAAVFHLDELQVLVQCGGALQ